MRSAIHVSALLIMLGGCLGLVTAQQHAVSTDAAARPETTQAAIVDDFDNEATGSIHLASVPRLPLSDEQRGYIFLGVINLRDVPEAAIDVPEQGTLLQENVDLHDIPPMVVRRIPQLDGYKFVKLDDRILLVSSKTRQVDATIPRYKLVFR